MPALTLADDSAPTAPADRQSIHRLVAWASTSLVAALWLIALILLARRGAGSFTKTLAAPTLLAVGLVSAISAVADRAVLWSGRPVAAWRWAVPGIGAILLALIVTLPGISPMECLLLWWAPVSFEIAAWWWFRQRPLAAAMAAEPTLVARPAELGEEEPPPSEVTQHLERSRSEEGGELLSGWLRIDFAPRQRSASAHLAFCPPFLATPMAEAAPIEGPEAEVQIGEVHAFGVRFDVKLKHASAEACRVGIEVSVWEAGAGESSATA